MNMIKSILILAFVAFSGSVWADYAIIVNSNSGVASLSKSELKNIYFGNKSSLGNANAAPCVWGAHGGDAFFSDILGVSKSEFNQEWVKKELTGAGKAPTVRDTVNQIIQCVNANPGGIGYIPSADTSKLSGSAKVIALN